MATARARKSKQPRASRPHMPGYGLLGTKSGRGLLPWSWAVERLTKTHNYWIATTRPDGAPHAMPVWGVWHEGAFYFSTGRQSRKARNLAANPRCVVCTERASEAVIVEGVAQELKDGAILRSVGPVYRKKYKWDFEAESPVFAVRPRVVFGLIEDPDEFASAATRWSFEAG
ncbi:MAG TPA: pyridoxamine 5'-phosphate oxidase family protein [Terriglobales bacterium]|jgi:nitroimidazol reductase NimA-like FMN-containing flavoprotein (pyridoxamine 5'-phosphate oxidase superfamily)|nr:pyridoxamine 5'-phosphate oxidase family protein [Terriglobales bacterium]